MTTLPLGEKMKLEDILKDINKYYDSNNIIILNNLKDKIEKTIRTETCYKTTSKTRVNAIKNIASKNKAYPILAGYGTMEQYKVVTDSYHAIAIIQEDMPLEYKENFPKMNGIFSNFDKSLYKETTINFNDMMGYYKMHKKDAYNNPYQIEENRYNINYLKNIIDVLGTDSKIYIPINKKEMPLFIENNNNELGLLLPIIKY